MTDIRDRLSRKAKSFEPVPGALERVLERASRRRRARTVATTITALGVFALAAVGIVAAFRDADRRHAPNRSPYPTSAPVHVPAHLGAMVAAEDALWAVGLDSRRRSEHYLLRLDPATGDVLTSTPVPGATLVAATTDRLWVTTFDLGALLEIDPRTMEIVRTMRLGRIGTFPYLATDGSSVFVVRNTDVLRLDPGARTPVVLARIADVEEFATPAGIAYLDGSVWVASGGTAEVFRFDARTGALQTTIEGTAAGESAGLGAAGGYVWAMGPSSLLRIDPATNETTPVPGGSPYGIAEGAGSVWIVDTEHLWKIDADSGTSIQLNGGGDPVGIAVAGGSVWVTNAADGTLVRLPACQPTCRTTAPADPAEPFGSVWPEDTAADARAAEERIGSGLDMWRTDPREVASRFAAAYFNWRNGVVAEAPSDEAGENVMVALHPSTADERRFEIWLRRGPGGTGWWVVHAGKASSGGGPIGLGIEGRVVNLIVRRHAGAWIDVEIGYGGRVATREDWRGEEFRLPFEPNESGHIVVVWRDIGGRAIDVWATSLPAGDFAAS